MFFTVIIAVGVLVLIFLYASIRILREYERGVVFTLGRYTGTKGPGLILLYPFIQQMVRVDLRVVVDEVPPQPQRELLDFTHPVLLGEGVDGVLLGVGGDDLGVVAGQVRVGEVAAQRGGHVQVLDLVPLALASDADQPDLRLTVLIVTERDGHGEPHNLS